jgi:dUTP pyrophosphatase
VSTIVKILPLPHADGLPLPVKATREAAGFDVVAAVPEGAGITLAPGARAAIPLGFKIELPPGWEAQIRPRSGFAFKNGVVGNFGTVDADFRGEVLGLLFNFGTEPLVVRRGDRVAQMVIAPVATVILERADVLSATDRGEGGFGSTGVR